MSVTVNSGRNACQDNVVLDKEDKVTLISVVYLICAHYRTFLPVFLRIA